jgi:uroporphyrinogen-III decarboxylase
MPTAFLGSYTRPDIRAAFQTILDAGEELAKWRGVVADFSKEANNAGFPSLRGGVTMAPFDTIGDTLRGTKGIIRDMFRQPDKLHEAMERITPMNIEAAVSAADAVGGPIIFMPLHKGDDVFMSDEQFETFYWPTFRKVIMGLVEEGCIPLLFAEGRYNRRLEVIKDLPKGTVLWQFDQTDMASAKEILGGTACISGNVPTSLLCTGTPQAVKDCCRNLIEVCSKDGGFILTGGASIDRGNPDNLHAMVEAVEEFGVYV